MCKFSICSILWKRPFMSWNVPRLSDHQSWYIPGTWRPWFQSLDLQMAPRVIFATTNIESKFYSFSILSYKPGQDWQTDGEVHNAVSNGEEHIVIIVIIIMTATSPSVQHCKDASNRTYTTPLSCTNNPVDVRVYTSNKRRRRDAISAEEIAAWTTCTASRRRVRQHCRSKIASTSPRDNRVNNLSADTRRHNWISTIPTIEPTKY